VSETLHFILRFYAPLFLAIVLILLIVVTPKILVQHSLPEVEVKLWVLGVIIPLGLWLRRIWVVRTVLLVVALSSAFAGVAIDVSQFFPPHLKMDVYFDLPGIRRTLSIFTVSELAEVGIPADWEQYLPKYDQAVTTSLAELGRANPRRAKPNVPTVGRSNIHGSGETSFIVKRVGFFAYRLTESEGLLDFAVEEPRKPPTHFRTSFSLVDTAGSHLRPSFRQLMTAAPFLIEPEFKQILSIEDGALNAPFDHIVVGLTKISILPLPEFSNTLYLWVLPDGTRTPVGYAVYYQGL
jgi:hypothetical protein